MATSIGRRPALRRPHERAGTLGGVEIRMRLIRRLRNALTCGRVVALFVLVESLIRWVSLPRTTRLLGVRFDLRPTERSRSTTTTVALSIRAGRQLAYTGRVAGHWPFGSGPCLRRSLVAAHLLRSSGATLRLGIPTRPQDAIAHAWVEIDGQPLEDISAYRPFTDAIAGGR